MVGEINKDAAYGMYPAPVQQSPATTPETVTFPPVTCDSRDETGFNPDLVLHRVDRGRRGVLREAGAFSTRAAWAQEAAPRTTRAYVVDAFNGGSLPGAPAASSGHF